MAETLSVLYIEDNRVDQMAFKRAVKEQGLAYAYEIAGSVAEAREILHARSFDIVVSDLHLGDGTLFDYVDDIVAKGTPLLVMTGMGDEESAVRAIKAGADDYLIKDGEQQYLRIMQVTVESAIRNRKAGDLNRKLFMAVEQSHSTIVITDTAGKIEYANPTFARLTGYTLDEAKGKNPSLLKSGAHPPEVYRELWETIVSGSEWRGELCNRRKDGSLYWEAATISPVKNRYGVTINYMKVAEDVTARRLAEEEIRKLNDQLRQRAQLLEEANRELDGFCHTITHDLRSPLSVIDGFVAILLEDYREQLNADGQELLGRIGKNAGYMGQFINHLLTFYRSGLRTMEPETVHISSLVKDVLEELHVDREKVTFTVQDLPPARGDRVLLHHVVQNLVANAVKFTKYVERPAVEIGSSPGEGGTVYFVRDNGVGFDMKLSHKLFKVCERLHGQEKFEGSGMGLSIVQRIVHRHGGRVWAQGKVGEGATFSFFLPHEPPGEEDA